MCHACQLAAAQTLLEVFCIDHFIVRSSGQGVINLFVNELGDHADRTISENELRSRSMVASEIFKVSDRAVGRMVTCSDDPLGGSIRFMNVAMPNRAPETSVTLSDHQGLAQAIEYVTETMIAVTVKQSVSGFAVVMYALGSIDAHIV